MPTLNQQLAAGLRYSDYLSPQKLANWFSALGIPDAPMRRQGLITTLRYFETYAPRAARPVQPVQALSYVQAMDLSKPVRRALIHKGEMLQAARMSPSPNPAPEWSLGEFFTRSGRSMYNSGIATSGASRTGGTANRQTVYYEATSSFEALESTAAPAIDTWTRQMPGTHTTPAIRTGTLGMMAAGGSLQLLVFRSEIKLQQTRIAPEKP